MTFSSMLFVYEKREGDREGGGEGMGALERGGLKCSGKKGVKRLKERE